MSKLSITEDIEFALFDYFHIQRSIRCSLEANVLVGRVDLLAMNKKDEMICVEIKVTYQDFKSKNGHNLIGNRNYYAVPPELVDKIKNEVPSHIGIMSVNVIYNGSIGRVKIVKNAKKIIHNYPQTMIDIIKSNMWVALNSNTRRLLRFRSIMNYKHKTE